MKDLDVRKALRSELARDHYGDLDTLIVEEMGIWSGSVRVDIAVVNGEIHGFEIKSARDTLARLPAQAQLYSQVFDRVTLVVAENHTQKAALIIPPWWGILGAAWDNSTIALTPTRSGSCNPNINPLQVARLLWRDELVDILERRDAIKGLRSASVERLRSKLCDELAIDELKFEIRCALKLRTWSRKSARDEREVPVCADLNPLQPTASAPATSRN